MRVFCFITSVKHPEQRYRLRQGQTIVGFMREISSNSIFYSRGGWWNGQKIDYNEVDEWTGFKDKNGRHVYEWDILRYKIDPDDRNNRKGVVLWQGQRKEFGILDIDVNTFIPLEVEGIKMFSERQLQVYTYLFLNPELKERIGIK